MRWDFAITIRISSWTVDFLISEDFGMLKRLVIYLVYKYINTHLMDFVLSKELKFLVNVFRTVL